MQQLCSFEKLKLTNSATKTLIGWGRAVLCPARFEHVSPVTERQFATMSYADPLNETKIQKLCRKNSNRRAGL